MSELLEGLLLLVIAVLFGLLIRQILREGEEE